MFWRSRKKKGAAPTPTTTPTTDITTPTTKTTTTATATQKSSGDASVLLAINAGGLAYPSARVLQAALDDVLARISGLHGAMRSELEATRKKAEDLEAQLQPHIDFHRRLMQMNAGLLASQGAQAPGNASGARSA